MLRTRECTVVYYGPPDIDQLYEISTRLVQKSQIFNQRVFHSDDRFDEDVVLEALETMLEEKVAEKLERRGKRESKPKKPQPTWRDKINHKREFIKRCIQNQAVLNLKAVARYTKSGYNTVKRVHDDMYVQGYVSPYEYNNLKSLEDMNSLQRSITEIEEGFKTVTDLKREYPTFSKRFILKELHSQDYRWHMLPRERKNPLHNPPSSTRVCRVISHISQSLLDPEAEILYIDEVKFPLFQTSTHSWVKQGSVQGVVYNRRAVPDTVINVIAMCSTSRFVAIQVFSREVTGIDFLSFLNQAIASLPLNKKYSILLDNAGWHHASLVERSNAYRFLFFNEPRMFQLNIIENAFSFVRSNFRKRPTVDTLQEEAREIVKIFFDPRNIRKFKGLLRNHLRQLIKFLKKHKAN